MADFQPVQKRGVKSAAPTVKYPASQQLLVDMGFDPKKVQKALETARGNVEEATVLLLSEGTPAPVENVAAPAVAPVATEEKKHSKSEKKSERSVKSKVTDSAPVPAAATGTAEELAEVHRKMMATYKISKCKDSASKTHDRKNCMHWHTYSDRRRNPFEFTYSSYECPNVVGGAECPVGDSCGHSHSMLERMFHPELYKISYCERLEGGKKCDRGVYCAFAHTAEDLRVSPSKLDPTLADKPPAKPATADIVIPDEIKDRLIDLIKDYGKDGVHSSELYKKYQIKYNEPLDFWADKYGAKYKMKEMLEAHPNVSSEYTRGHQPVYVYVDTSLNLGSGDSHAKNTALVRDRLVQLVRDAGEGGIAGADLPKKYQEVFGEKLELIDASGERLKMKETLTSHPGISVANGAKQQPRYTFDASVSVEKPKVKSWSAIAAGADKPKPAAAPIAPVAPAVVAAVAAPAAEITTASKAEPAAEVEKVSVSGVPAVAPKAGVKSFAAVVAAKSKSKEAVVVSSAAAAAPVSTVTEHDPVIEAKAEEPQAVVETVPEQSVAVEVSTSVVDQLLAAVGSSSLVDASPSVGFSPSAVLSTSTSGLTLPGESSSMSKLVSHVAIGDISDSAVSLPPSVFPLSGDGGLSSSLLFGIDKSDDPSTGSQPSKLHELLYKASSLDIKRSEHSIMPPGLTRQPKSDKLDDDLSRKLAQAQNQVISQQEQINALQKELASRKVEFDAQAAQLKSTQALLKEAESRSDDSLRAQLKSKDDELHNCMLQYTEELKRVNAERTVDYNSAYGFFQQMEQYIAAQKIDDNNVELYPKDRLVELAKILSQFGGVSAGWKDQWKYKLDLLTQPQRLPFMDPYSASNRGFAMQYSGQPVYDHSYFYNQGSYGAAPQPVCALPGCNQIGVITCTGCYRVSYCSHDHQSMHYPQHVSSCH